MIEPSLEYYAGILRVFYSCRFTTELLEDGLEVIKGKNEKLHKFEKVS